MTPEQCKRLAEEARGLAMECVDGTAPELVRGLMRGRKCCAIGRVSRRALGKSIYIEKMDEPEDTVSVAMWIVIDGNDCAETPDERRDAVVFPLLALADALEDARSAK